MPDSNAEKTSKKIFILGPAAPYRGGIAHFQESMERGLRLRGHNVQIVNYKRLYPDLFFPGKTQYDPDAETDKKKLAPRLLDSIDPRTWTKTADKIIACKPDVVILKYWLPFFAPMLGIIGRRLKKAGIRVVGHVHNAIPQDGMIGAKLLGRFFIGGCDAFLVMSKEVEGDVIGMKAKGKITRIAHPVYTRFGSGVDKDTACTKLELDPAKKWMLFFGYIRRYKGLHTLLEALPLIIKDNPDLNLVVAGEFYEDEGRFRKIIQQYKLGRRVTLRNDYIPDGLVKYYFSAADLVVQPYLKATQSGVAQVAYQFDKPMIVSDVGGLPEMVPHEKSGLIFPAGDVIALADSINRFYAEELKEKLTEGVIEEKKKYEWDRLYEAVEGLI